MSEPHVITPPTGPFEFWKRCDQLVRWEVDAANDMVYSAREITLRTFRKNIGAKELQRWKKQHGYGRDLPLSKDWHVTYYKSKFAGEPVYYLCWSAYEYIWRRSHE